VVAVYFILLKLALVTALALLFSCFSTPLLSTLFTVGIYITGLFSNEIRTFSSITGSRVLDTFAVALSYLLPNFNNFNAIASAAHGRAIPRALIIQNTIYAAVYIAVVLLVAAVTFSRRNLK
jgi:ABC-type transport system involved in multi-copper enzyme maturation permease subunit